MSEAKSVESQTLNVQLNLKERLKNHPRLFKLIHKILHSSIYKSDSKFRSINSAKLEGKCHDSSEFTLICDIMRYSGFNRTIQEDVARWVLPEHCSKKNLIEVLEIVRVGAVQNALSTNSQGPAFQVWPPKSGVLRTEKVELWVRGQVSFSQRSSFGDVRVQLSFVNESNAPILIRWVNFLGKERVTDGDQLRPRESRMINSFLNHAFSVRDIDGKALCGYKATMRKNGHHVILIGNVNGVRVKEIVTNIIRKTPKDTRLLSTSGPPPAAPHHTQYNEYFGRWRS